MSRARASAEAIPVFDGFPYLSIDLGEGIAHVVPLPATASRHELQQLAFRQVLAWRRPFALVFGHADALLFDANGGSVRAGEAPRARWALAGRTWGRARPAGDAEVEARERRLEAFSAGQ